MTIYTIIALVGGVIAASNILGSFNPKVKELLAKLTPIQGIVGIVLVVVGILSLLSLNFSTTFTTTAGILGFATVALTLLVGFLLGFALLNQYVFSKICSGDGCTKLQAKLAPFQGILGLALVGVIIVNLVL